MLRAEIHQYYLLVTFKLELLSGRMNGMRPGRTYPPCCTPLRAEYPVHRAARQLYPQSVHESASSHPKHPRHAAADRIRQFLKRGLERRYEMMRQLANKAYGIGQEDFLRVRNAFFTRGRVECIEQTVVCLDARTGQGVQQCGLARVRVADNGN